MSTQETQFIEHLEKVKPLILKVVRVYCYNSEDQKDLFQEIVIQLWKSFPKYNPKYALTTWTYRIALNVSISYIRKSNIRKKHNSSFVEHQNLVQWQYNHELDEDLLKLYAIINKMAELDKAVITLHLEGVKNKEIAEIIGITASNVSTRLQRIKEKIKSKF